jgi:hypothetical protein
MSTYRLGKLVRVDAKDVGISVRHWSAAIAEKHHYGMVAFRVMIEVTDFCQFQTFFNFRLFK